MKARFLEAAHAEFREAVDYFNGRRAAAVERIKFWPHGWTRASKRARMCRVKRFRYVVIYVPRESEILVVAVMHGHRRPSYWKKRLRGLDL